ncbi:transcription factor FapR [Halobacillus sp. ACCC02827]|uniref:transcription factor FapR n=1 Tax=Bacillaceae TaxID=186817 RepID=UPI0002A4E685|nr:MULTISPECIES: transcription factor FapR [Bacillaceae]ELK46114.1 fatty acid biosynthesis transcriptional regulator [Halobacillus sp. BAB-2008]QHT46622.1 transcription factor FapR [Bacillus sp. SB49]WJE17435.1 transcription factor FapR [Halobacillus sp. ACCC02827]
MRKPKKIRQEELKNQIDRVPFITDEELAKTFGVSIQTIRLDRMEMGIPELRERIKSVANQEWNGTVKALPIEEVIGEVVDLELDDRAISILDIRPDHVFSRNHIARGHHLFAQANSLAVALIDDELALTARSTIHFSRPVKLGERVVAKATVQGEGEKGRTIVKVHSYVGQEEVFAGTFEMYRSKQ